MMLRSMANISQKMKNRLATAFLVQQVMQYGWLSWLGNYVCLSEYSICDRASTQGNDHAASASFKVSSAQAFWMRRQASSSNSLEAA